MKKLMLAAAAVALAGSVSAVEAYTYKASVKHTYLKARSVTKILGTTVAKQSVYVKYLKTTSLDGYLIQDDTELLWSSANNPTITGKGTKTDQPANRCFLVVRNKSAEKGFKFARILPGVIEAKWYDDKLSATGTSPAQGYLFIGGEVVATATGYRGTTFDVVGTRRDGAYLAGDPTAGGVAYTPRAFGNWTRLRSLQGTVPNVPGVGIDDYFFTSAYLFGQFNQPEWADQTDYVREYADTWMNHAGFGKAVYSSTIKYCCNRKSGTAGTVLDNLAGSLKAGIWLCTENGENDEHNVNVAGFITRKGRLEDQLWKGVRWNNTTVTLPVSEDGATYNIGLNTTGTAPSARTVLDLWADGNLDLRTTDVGTGTWSIKRTTSLKAEQLTAAENAVLTTAPVANEVNTEKWGLAAPTKADLIEAIKGALVALKTGNPLFGDVLDGALINYSFYNAYLK